MAQTGAAVEPFGSFVSNLFTRWSDMDISINLPKCGSISYVENDRKQSSSKKEKKEEKDYKNFLLVDLQKAMLRGNLLCVQAFFILSLSLSLSLSCLYSVLPHYLSIEVSENPCFIYLDNLSCLFVNFN